MISRTPVNLMETIEPDSSGSYIRRVMARVLGHALCEGLTWTDIGIIWEQSGHDPGMWDYYRQMICGCAYG